MTDNISPDSAQPVPEENTPAHPPVDPAVPAAVTEPAAAPAAPAAAELPVAPAAVPAAPAPAHPSSAHPAAGATPPNATVYAPGTPPQPYASQHTGQPGYPPQPQQHAYPQYAGQQHAQQQPPQYAGQQHAPQYAQQHTQPTVPIPGAAFGVGGPNGPTGPGGAAGPGQQPAAPKRTGVGMLVAALVIGALVGGGSAAGVMAISGAQNQGRASTNASAPQNVVVNNTDSVNEITAVAAQATPSVVTISVTGASGAGTGSGVVLSSDGYVLTNTHVVTLDGESSDPQIQVTMSDGTLYQATVVGTDPISDLAVIQLKDATGLTPLKFADSSKLNVGDTAIAIGAPLGLAGTVTNGIVSALNRSITVASSAVPANPQQDNTTPGSPNDNFPFNFDFPGQGGQNQQAPNAATGSISLAVVQTDAAINPGNSGGALLNSQGQLIGINVAIATAGNSSGGSGSIGVGFAIPANLAQRVAGELIKNGAATHGLLGATVSAAASVEGSTTVGAYIADVTAGGPAASAGLAKGDVITRFNGVPITDANDLTAQVRTVKGGGDATLTYVRAGKSYDVDVTLGTLGS